MYRTSLLNKPVYFMTKLEKIWWIGVTIAAVCIPSFWIAGLNGQTQLAEVLILAAGCFSIVALIVRFLCCFRKESWKY